MPVERTRARRHALNNVSGDRYSADCGVTPPVGKAYVVDTNYETPTPYGDTLDCNTEESTKTCPSVAGCSWKTGHNRTDVPWAGIFPNSLL